MFKNIFLTENSRKNRESFWITSCTSIVTGFYSMWLKIDAINIWTNFNVFWACSDIFLKNWFQFVIFEYSRSDELPSQFIFSFSISIVFNIQLTFVWKNIQNVLCLLYHLKMFLRSKIMSLFSFPFNCANVGKSR